MKSFPVRYIFFFVVLLLCAGISSSASYPTSPKDVVAQYLRLDSEAAGIAESTWPELAAYTTWTQPPTWETFMVIDRYEIGKQMVGSTRAQVNVTYYPLGKLTATFEPSTQPEAVYYHLNKVAGQWKVDAPQLIPHVVWPVMKKRLEDASAKNPAVKTTNDALIAQIDAVKSTAK